MPVSLLPGCNHLCPACRHVLLSQAESVAQKSEFLQKKLSAWCDRLHPVIHEVEKETVGYRDKVTLSSCYSDGWQVGVMRRDELIPIPGCPVHSARVRNTIAFLLSLLPPAEEFPMVYWVQSGAQLVMVLKSRTMPSLGWLTASLSRGLAELGIEGLWIHLHPSAGKKVFGKGGWNLLWGVAQSVSGDGLRYGPAAFQQLIPSLYKQSLDVAENFLLPSDDSLVIDLYCGVGGSLRRWRNRGALAIGVEVSGDAVELAPLNAPGSVVLRGSCAQRIPQLTDAAKFFPRESRLLYANPPRTGLEPEVTEWIATTCRPARIAYMSCSAGTLSRDLSILETAGYYVRSLIPFDFFPRTIHVECVALLEDVGV